MRFTISERPVLVFDMEVFWNWTLFYFRNVVTREEYRFEHPLDLQGIKALVRSHRLVTFNGAGYDIPLLMLALTGADAKAIKAASNRIIEGRLKPWNFEKEFKVKVNPPGLDHIDLMKVAPMTGSLKLYGARMHSRFIQELPVDHTREVDLDEIETLTRYCSNDLETTEDLYRSLAQQLDLRTRMSVRYGIDLRSKSDAQIAEAVIKSEVEKIVGERVFRPGDLAGDLYRYQVPDWVSFRIFEVLDTIRAAQFIVNDKGKVVMPPEVRGLELQLGASRFTLGIGGLHSTEERQVVEADAQYVLMDFDVASYYPAIILNQSLYPAHLGPQFLQTYQTIVQQRLNAKIRAIELKKEIAKIKETIYNLENETKEPNVSSSAGTH